MIEDKRTVRVGLIGYGYAGKTFHAPLIRSVPGLELTIVGSSKRDIVSADLPGVAVYPNMEEVATHPEVDLLVIASPNESHYPLAAAALLAGKHVVVDKPFTVKLADARSLVQLAEEQGKLLSVFHNRRWDSEVLATKAIVQSGVLGEISHFETHIDRFRPQVRQRWREQAGPGAGLWFDLGPHLIDQAVQLFGLPLTINASFAVLRKGGETDDWAHVQLNYKSLRVILHASLLVSEPLRANSLEDKCEFMRFGIDGWDGTNDPEIALDGNLDIHIAVKEIPVPRGEDIGILLATTASDRQFEEFLA
jgi:predicted dehydrogenase